MISKNFQSKYDGIVWTYNEKLLNACEQTDVLKIIDDIYNIDITSFGVCDIENSELPPNPTNLFLSAEKAMYAAKEHGKNRVECFLNKVNTTK